MPEIIDLETFKKVVDNAYDHIVITDTDGHVLYANNAVEKITGFSKSEILGHKAGKLWGGIMEAEFYEKLWDTIKNKKKTFIGELVNKRKNGDRYTAEVNITPVIIDGNLKYFIGLERDISTDKSNKNLVKLTLSREERVVQLKNKIKALEDKLKAYS